MNAFRNAALNIFAFHQGYYTRKAIEINKKNLEKIDTAHKKAKALHPDHIVIGFHGGKRPVQLSSGKHLFIADFASSALRYASKTQDGEVVIVQVPKKQPLKTIDITPIITPEAPGLNLNLDPTADRFRSGPTSTFIPAEKIDKLNIKLTHAQVTPLPPQAILYKLINSILSAFV